MKRKIVSLSLALASLVFGLLSPRVLLGDPAVHTRTVSVEDFDIVVSAAEGCSGEDVHVFGTLDIIVTTTTDSRGGLHATFHLTPHLTAIGLSSGLEYLAVGPTQFVSMVDGTAPSVSAGVNVTMLVAPGSTDNLVLKETIHVTVNANGTTTVEFDNLSFTCRG